MTKYDGKIKEPKCSFCGKTSEQVRRLVEYAKFPPVGNRGFCPTRDGGWGHAAHAVSISGYMETSNRRSRPSSMSTSSVRKMRSARCLSLCITIISALAPKARMSNCKSRTS